VVKRRERHAPVESKIGDRLTTVFPRQGHYALDPEIVGAYPPADITIKRIGELVKTVRLLFAECR